MKMFILELMFTGVNDAQRTTDCHQRSFTPIESLIQIYMKCRMVNFLHRGLLRDPLSLIQVLMEPINIELVE